MNKLNFSMLELTVESEIHSLRDDGFVPDITEHTKKVYLEFWGTDKGLEEAVAGLDANPGGRYILFKEGETITAVIFYKYEGPLTEILRRAHEETHVLHAIGRLDLLEERLHQLGVQIDLTKYSDFDTCTELEREVVANIGGFYALQRRGADITKLSVKGPQSIKHAVRLYQQALQQNNH